MKDKDKRSLDCKYCGRTVKNVGDDAVAVICWECAMKSIPEQVIKEDEEDDKDNQ